MSASGFSLPPLIIYPRKRAVPDNLKVGAIPGTVFENIENDCMDKSGYIYEMV